MKTRNRICKYLFLMAIMIVFSGCSAKMDSRISPQWQYYPVQKIGLTDKEIKTSVDFAQLPSLSKTSTVHPYYYLTLHRKIPKANIQLFSGRNVELTKSRIYQLPLLFRKIDEVVYYDENNSHVYPYGSTYTATDMMIEYPFESGKLYELSGEVKGSKVKPVIEEIYAYQISSYFTIDLGNKILNSSSPEISEWGIWPSGTKEQLKNCRNSVRIVPPSPMYADKAYVCIDSGQIRHPKYKYIPWDRLLGTLLNNDYPTVETTVKKDKYIQKTFTNQHKMDFISIELTDNLKKMLKTDEIYMGRTEVTRGQWLSVMGNNPHSNGDCMDCPVTRVNLKDIEKFVRKLNEEDGQNNYFLPSHSLWKYAAGGGNDATYSFGDNSSLLSEYAWYKVNSGGKIHPVAQKKANPWGLYDVHGNALEFVSDSMIYYTDNSGPVVILSKNVSGFTTVVGGDYTQEAKSNTTNTYFSYPINAKGCGFRLARFRKDSDK
jgi:hypothetical protein